MSIKSIEAPNALDLRLREPGGGAAKQKNNSLRAPTAPPPDASEQDTVDAAPPAPRPSTGPNLKFSTDEKTGKSVVALIDPVDGRVLRQFPSEEAIKVAEAIGRFQGMFVDLKV